MGRQALVVAGAVLIVGLVIVASAAYQAWLFWSERKWMMQVFRRWFRFLFK